MASLQPPWGSFPAQVGLEGPTGLGPGCCGSGWARLPRHTASAAPPIFGFGYPAMYPPFVPFVGCAPAFFYQMGSPFLTSEASNVFGHTAVPPCESSNSNDAINLGTLPPTVMYRGDAGSRVSLECSSSRTNDTATTGCTTEPAHAKGTDTSNSLCCSESILDPSLGPGTSADLGGHGLLLSAVVPNLAQLEPQRWALERAGSSTALPPLAASAHARPSPPAQLQPQVLPPRDASDVTQQLQVLDASSSGRLASGSADATGTGVLPPPYTLRGDSSSYRAAAARCGGAAPVAPTQVGVAATGGAATVAATVAASAETDATGDTLYGASMSMGSYGRVPLRALSGGFVWVGARRYQAIVRRRRQREKKLGCVVVASPSRGLQPCIHAPRHQRTLRRPRDSSDRRLLCAEGDSPPRLAPNGSSCSDACPSDGDGGCAAAQDGHLWDDAIMSDDSHDHDHHHHCRRSAGEEDSQAEAGTRQLGAGAPPPAAWAGGLGPPCGAWPDDNALVGVAPAPAPAPPPAPAPASAPALVALPEGSLRAALEAELRAVLAEETGVLMGSLDGTEGDEAESVGGGGGGGDGGGERDLEGGLQGCSRPAEALQG